MPTLRNPERIHGLKQDGRQLIFVTCLTLSFPGTIYRFVFCAKIFLSGIMRATLPGFVRHH